MARRRVLLLLKPMDLFTTPRPDSTSSSSLHTIHNPHIKHLEDRYRVHKETINFCQDVLQSKPIEWQPLLRNNLSQPIRNVDLVITIGGDGTLLQASHYMNNSVPILGVNSDPTQADEVREFSNEFDATRSTGYLCAATAGNFEQVIDEIIAGHTFPSELSRISVSLNGQGLSTYALNDVLIAHPCPATASRFSFLMREENEMNSSLVNCRSSGLRVSTAAGSTAAMLSAGGFPMPVLSKDLQYMVREPILTGAASPNLMHGILRPNQTMHVTWYCKKGVIYVDGSHVFHLIHDGDTIEISSNAPTLKVFLPSQLLR